MRISPKTPGFPLKLLKFLSISQKIPLKSIKYLPTFKTFILKLCFEIPTELEINGILKVFTIITKIDFQNYKYSHNNSQESHRNLIDSYRNTVSKIPTEFQEINIRNPIPTPILEFLPDS